VSAADLLLADAGAVRALAADALEPAPDDGARIARVVAAAFGDATLALIHYGSHAQRSGARSDSAYDYFVIVRGYEPAYRALAATRGLRRSPRTAALLNRILPPNVLALRIAGEGETALAKCAVLSLADLERAVSPRARDHFVLGRLFQHVQLLEPRDGASRDAVLRCIAESRARTIDWGRPYLPERFDADRYLLALLARSFAGEIRPEAEQRLDALTGAQRGALAPVYAQVLQRLESLKITHREGDVHRLAEAVPAAERRRWERYFARSKRRATARWGKYVLLYDDWLAYLLAKIERRSGQRILLTEKERRWPLIFLWPRAFRYLRQRPQVRR